VIGNGPIGASVAKNLIASLASAANSISGDKRRDTLVTIVDGSLSGIGSSHSDRARLIRTFDAEGDLDWTRWNQRSLEAFPEIERVWNNEYNTRNSDAASHENTTTKRKSFFKKCGALLIGDEEFVARSKKAAEELSSSPSFSLLSPTEYQMIWPYLKPKSGCDVALFDPSGGIIDPFAFIEAQNHNAMSFCSVPEQTLGETNHRNNGGVRLEIISDAVTNIDIAGTTVKLASGETRAATEKIILCGGAFSASLLSDSTLLANDSLKLTLPTLRVSKRTVALLEVSTQSAKGILRDMPTIKYAFGLNEATTKASNSADGGEHSRVEAGSVYILPPVLYPERDGKWFVKIGGGPNDFFEGDVTAKKELDAWLATEGNSSSAEWLGNIGKSLLSEVDFESLHSMSCVTTTSTALGSNGVVVDDVLGDGRVIAISACQGKGAGPSDALGADIVRSIM